MKKRERSVGMALEVVIITYLIYIHTHTELYSLNNRIVTCETNIIIINDGTLLFLFTCTQQSS